MRLGVDAWGLGGPLAYTGMGQYTLHLLTGIHEVAPDIDVFAYGAPGEQRPAWLPDAVSWQAPDTRVPPKLAGLVSRLRTVGELARRDGLDVFHAPAVHVRPSMPPIASVPCPLVATVHDLIPLTFYGATMPVRLRLFYRWNLHRALAAESVVTVSETARQEIAGHAPRAKITVIPNGVEPPAETHARASMLPTCNPYVLYAGSYEPRKNLVRALDAYAMLATHVDTYDLVAIVDAGSGHEAVARAHLSSLGIERRVHLVHGLDDAELQALYAGARVLFFPSLAEGFGLPPLQAAAHGVPVVASDLPAVREIMQDAALFVSPRDIAAMAQALRTAVTDEDLRHRLIAAGYERAQEYTWRRSVERHAALYRAVSAQR
ncbi:MAG TPA: glycosyltransferase family 1 protein [Dehalococcoidia bacterium]|nr:glycosyltransferase family 1 protein [Dehalococcoidia bacterium]